LGFTHKVFTYVEYRAVSDVFQNIDPPSPLLLASVSSPRTVRGVGGQYFGRRQPEDWPLTIISLRIYRCVTHGKFYKRERQNSTKKNSRPPPPPKKKRHKVIFHSFKIASTKHSIFYLFAIVWGFIIYVSPVHSVMHIVDRVLGLFSSRPNWDPPHPHPQANVYTLPLVPGEHMHSLAGEGVGPSSDEGTETVVL
jgi:hypothetical protein